ncbi:MAG: T9SS type A sorting domain-containing protein, partial [Candidatus Kapabacteria bacterium]|nr:T9SS type A sorting domain-containing protein [Candidatus Kapabacteria bacterium]
AYDGTEVFINGVRVVTLDRGGFYEAPLVTPAEIQASAPVLVAQFKKTAGGSGNRLLSDPFMMIVPPKEQFMNKYRVINVQVFEGFIPDAVYDAQYICLVAPEDQINGITLDGQPVNPSAFSRISTSGYSFANFPVSDGVHRIESSADIGIYVYGYGIANSYGYVGGMSFIPLDLNPPQIAYADSCFSVKGIATDSTASDFGIKELYSPPNSQKNVTVNIEPFIPLKKIVKFSANLIDNRQDGKFKLIAIDSLGRKNEKDIDIPGFTVALSTNILADTVKLVYDQIKVKREICKDIEIKNYGAFKQYISNLYFKNNSKIKINYNTPKELLPNQTDIITLCYEFPNDTIINDTLVIEGPCNERDLAALSIIVAGDREPPVYQISSDDCEINFRINITDSSAFDYGIEKIEILEQTNCNINLTSFNSRIVSYSLNIIDPFKDAIYRFNSVDSAGNIKTFADTVQGFTLSFPGFESNTGNIHSFGRYFIGNFGCDTLELYNYGLLPLKLEKIFLANNILFSIPQSQLPFIIEPKETKKLIACFQPLSAEKDKIFHDTLNFGFKCNLLNFILNGSSLEITQQATSQCDVDVILVTDKLSEDFLVDGIRPIPMSNEGKFRLAQPRNSYVEIDIYNYLGQPEIQLFKGNLEKNNYEFKFDVSNLNDGFYFLVAKSGNQTVTRTFVVAKQ